MTDMGVKHHHTKQKLTILEGSNLIPNVFWLVDTGQVKLQVAPPKDQSVGYY